MRRICEDRTDNCTGRRYFDYQVLLSSKYNIDSIGSQERSVSRIRAFSVRCCGGEGGQLSEAIVPILCMIVVTVGAILVAGYFDFDTRLASWWVARANRLGRLTGPFSLAFSAALMLCYTIMLVAGMMLTERLGHWIWALCFMLPQTVVYAPFMFITSFSQSGYFTWRSDLKVAGASTKQQRQIAWWAGLPSFAGIMITIGVWMTMFLS